ncbi:MULTISPECIES: AAA family ATPase [unclassified Knoellia]|uniref:AAA family ATPase n=1 Tax=Knoellia altitudinis TaxID=3404795 RepID=UPI00360CA30E
MTTAVITGVSHHHEQELVTNIEDASGVSVVRRCADVAELMSTGASGIADVAIVSADFRGLDRDALRHLAGHGVRVAGFVTSGDDAGEARLRQLGVTTLVRPGADPEELARTVIELAEGVDRSARGGGPGPSSATSVSDADLARWLEDPTSAPGLGRDPDSDPGPGTAGGTTTSRDSGDPAAAAGSSPFESADARLADLSEPRRARVTAVWGPAGAPGRTTIAVTLAADLASRGVSTLLVDLDTWGASVAQALALIDEAPGVAAAARASEQGTLDRASLSRVAPEVSPGLRVLTGIPKPERWPELRAAAVEDVLEKSRSLVDHVVVDCGFSIEDDEELSYDTAAPRRNATTLTALETSDSLVVVGGADPIGLQRLVRAVQDVGVVPSPPPAIVVNKVRASAAGARPERAISDVLGRFAGLEEPIFVPWAPDECDAALLAGRSLVESAPAAPVTRAVARIVDVVRPDLAPAAETRVGRARARTRFGRPTRRSG